MRIYILTYVISKILRDYKDDEEFITFIENYNNPNFFNQYKFLIIDNNIDITTLRLMDLHIEFNFDFETNLIKIIINDDHIMIINNSLFNVPVIININNETMTFIKNIYRSKYEYKPKYFNYLCHDALRRNNKRNKYYYYDISKAKKEKKDDDIEYIFNIGHKLLKLFEN